MQHPQPSSLSSLPSFKSAKSKQSINQPVSLEDIDSLDHRNHDDCDSPVRANRKKELTGDIEDEINQIGIGGISNGDLDGYQIAKQHPQHNIHNSSPTQQPSLPSTDLHLDFNMDLNLNLHLITDIVHNNNFNNGPSSYDKSTWSELTELIESGACNGWTSSRVKHVGDDNQQDNHHNHRLEGVEGIEHLDSDEQDAYKMGKHVEDGVSKDYHQAKCISISQITEPINSTQEANCSISSRIQNANALPQLSLLGSLLNPSFSQSTHAYHHSQDTSFLSALLSTDRTHYSPLVNSLHLLLDRLIFYDDKAINRAEGYLGWLKRKEGQIILLRKEMKKNKGEKYAKVLQSNDFHTSVYFDFKVTLAEIWRHSNERLQQLTANETLIKVASMKLSNRISECRQESYRQRTELQEVWAAVGWVRAQLDRNASDIKIDGIMGDSTAMTENSSSISPESSAHAAKIDKQNKNTFKSPFPTPSTPPVLPKPLINLTHIKRDRYLLARYLLILEQYYLNHLSVGLLKVLKYANYLFGKQEKSLVEAVGNGLQAVVEVMLKEKTPGSLLDIKSNSSSDTNQLLKQCQPNRTELDQELKSRFLAIIPPQMLPSSTPLDGSIEAILDGIGMQFQPFLSMPLLQLPGQLIIFRRSCLFQTSISPVVMTQAELILTVDKFLHIQLSNKIQTYNLREIRLTHKGKQVLLTEKSRTTALIGMFVGRSSVLGRIVIENHSDIEEMQKILKR